MKLNRLILLLFALLTLAVPSQAVLKEKNLATTLSVLRAELQSTYVEQKQNIARFNMMTNMQHKQIVNLMQRSDLVSLMLYSQKQDFTFDMTYACHEATSLYREFNTRRMPYTQITQRIETEVNRYDRLITALCAIPPRVKSDGTLLNTMPAPQGAQPQQKAGGQGFDLDKQSLADRDSCLKYAVTLRSNLVKIKDKINSDNEHYKMTASKLKTLNDYALQRYSSIQNTIFVNGDANYFEVLSTLRLYLNNAKADVSEKYDTEHINTGNGTQKPVHSQWRGPIVTSLTFFVLFYVIVAALLSNVLVRFLVPKRFRTEEFMKKKVCLILAVAMFFFAVSIMIVRSFISHNFFLMASRLLIEFAWLLCAIFVSLLIRLNGDQIKSGFRIYTPIMLMSFIVITFRIIFVPNNVVQLIFPPILLVFTLWQWNVITRHNSNIPRTDIFYTWISLIIMVLSTAAAWYGYTLLSVQLLIWWMFQLSCIQTVTCIYDLLALYEERYLTKKIGEKVSTKPGKGHINILESIRTRHEKHINVTWFYDLVAMVVVPALGVFSVLLSVWWAADVFDLTATVINIFMYNFLNVPDVVQLSLLKIVLVASQYFVFRYLNYLIRALYHKYHKSKVVVNGKPNFTLANNIISICVWGTYFIISIKMLKIPSTAISVISAGLATGVGFAMKDLLENFFYGISLMTGRVRVGDYIECDGVRGKVESITYQSTQIVTADGCIIAFLNSSLFTKNFKNITRNHSYEMVSVPVGVAYGVNVDEVRAMLIDAVAKLEAKLPDGRDIISRKKPISVVFDDFGDNSVNLYLTYWVLVEQKFVMTGRVKETIYNTLNEHNIEIPYPQRDIHIRNVSEPLFAK